MTRNTDTLDDLSERELEHAKQVAENIETRAEYLADLLPEETRDKECMHGKAFSIRHEAEQMINEFRRRLHDGGLENYEEDDG